MKQAMLVLLLGVILCGSTRLARAAEAAHTLLGLADPPPVTGWASQVAAGDAHTCVLTPAGGVLCWGGGRAAPVAVPGLASGVQAITAGGGHSCALLTGGQVRCWGSNSEGQLGTGALSPMSSDTPVEVVGLGAGVQAISAGGLHTCALTAGGDVKCWGNNYRGQIGNGAFGYYELTPVAVVGLTSGVRAISAGGTHTCALTERGGVQCWGDNYYGQLGDGAGGNGVRRATPVAVVDLTSGVRAIEAGDMHTCALTERGGVLCWGWNGGTLGDGTTTARLTPVAVLGLTSGVQAISAGGYHTCALTELGGTQCWGDNYFGELGDGTQTGHLAPIAPPPLQNGFRAFSLGLAHTCAVTAAGGVQCWGANAAGQLGDWTTTDRWTPVDVRPLTFDCPAVTEIPTAECTALVALFTNTWGLGWTDRSGWLEATTPCDWHGVTCAEGHVRGLALAGNALAGPLPAELGQLTALQTLDLHSNRLEWLPPELGGLGELQTLDLSDNLFAAAIIPPELGRLGNLRQLNLRHATLQSVALPAELGQLRKLQVLDLSQNVLTGTLPAAWGDLTALQVLDLSRDNLRSPLPAAWGGLAALQILDLSANRLNGTLPTTWGNLTALQTLDLHANQLNGPVPAAWGGLTALQILDLSWNNLSGPLPPELGQLAAVKNLYLQNNHFSGPIPPELSQLAALRGDATAADRPAVTTHASTGVLYPHPPPIPPAWGYLDLSSNQLSGAIPPELGQLTGLNVLDLSGNQLRGTIPPELDFMAQRYWAYFGYNRLAITASWASNPWWTVNTHTQTIPPVDVRATVTGRTVTVTWTPIQYARDGGFYEVSYATTPCGSFTVHGHTADKTVSSYTVTGLPPIVTYYFRVRTFTPAHAYYPNCDGSGEDRCRYANSYYQQSDLWSDYSTAVRAELQRWWLPWVER